MAERVDVLIAGGGPVACALARALAPSPLSVLRVGSEAAGADRPIALSYGSRLILERLGAWERIAATPIERIHVSQRHGPGRTELSASDYGFPALGYVSTYAEVLGALAAAQVAAQVTVGGALERWEPSAECVNIRMRRNAGEAAVTARLLVLADGGTVLPPVRTSDYGQHAIVADVRAEDQRPGVAWERFTTDGPIALLPLRDHLALIWTTPSAKAKQLSALSDREFLAALQAAFGGRLGKFMRAGPRSAFPLALSYRAAAPGVRTLTIGNAAQTLHPVAGQGLNLGLRDAWELAELLLGAAPEAIGSAGFIGRFVRRRAVDRRAGIVVTDFLARIFSTSLPFLALARGAGLIALDCLPPARRFLAHRMIFGARALP